MRPQMPHEATKLPGPLERAAARIPVPRSAAGMSGMCTLAVGLISTGAAIAVFGAQGGAVDVARALWTAVCVGLGFSIIYVFKCHTMLGKGDA